jgi:heme-degrading monooxygenase HmoA
LSVLEVAKLQIREGAGSEFEASFAEAHELIKAADGYISSELHQVVDGDEYVLLVQWQTLEDHVEKFASSPDFPKFQGLIGPHLASEPSVDHFARI